MNEPRKRRDTNCSRWANQRVRFRLLVPLLVSLYAFCGPFAFPQGNEPAPSNASDSYPKQTSQETAGSEGSKNGEKNKKKSRGTLIGVPIPISSPAIGSGVILAGAYIFPFSVSDKISPPSTVGVAAMFTNNGTRGFGLGGELYFKEDTFHIRSAYARGNINYDFYGIGTPAGDAGLKLPLKQTGQLFLGEFQRRLWWKFFLGPRILAGTSTITLRPTNQETPLPPPDIGPETNLTSLGVRLSRDTRANHFYPTDGSVLDLTSDFYSGSLGSKYTFQSYQFTFNNYKSLDTKQVLAYNLYLCGTGGDSPFYGECIYGTKNELRGYVAGQYIDRYMIATQLEYRLILPKRFGLVAFAGLGEVAPSIGQFRYDNLLPAIGGGIRFQLSKQHHLNLRADIGQGKDGHTFSLGLGEAF